MTQASYLMGNWELPPEVSPEGCGCESLCVVGRGIQAGFAEEVIFGLGFEAQAGFHWLESQGRDCSEQSHKKAGSKGQEHLNKAAWGGGVESL